MTIKPFAVHAARATRRFLAMKVRESALAAQSCSFDDVANVAVKLVMSPTSTIHYIASLYS